MSHTWSPRTSSPEEPPVRSRAKAANDEAGVARVADVVQDLPVCVLNATPGVHAASWLAGVAGIAGVAAFFFELFPLVPPPPPDERVRIPVDTDEILLASSQPTALIVVVSVIVSVELYTVPVEHVGVVPFVV